MFEMGSAERRGLQARTVGMVRTEKTARTEETDTRLSRASIISTERTVGTVQTERTR